MFEDTPHNLDRLRPVAGGPLPSRDMQAEDGALSRQMARLIKQGQEQISLQQFANLGPDRILTINHNGTPFRLYLPFGDQDYIQRNILAKRRFYEARLLDELLSRGVVPAGGLVIDAGANIGNHAVFFSHFLRPKRMYAFEPQQLAFDTMVRNIELNPTDCDVSLVQAMLGAVAGRGDVASYKPANQGGAVFHPVDGGRTPMVTLDDTLSADERGRVSFIKIDVEGFQTQVLHGATDILTRSRPPLWVEVFAQEQHETDAILAPYGYTAHPLARDNYLYTADAGRPDFH